MRERIFRTGVWGGTPSYEMWCVRERRCRRASGSGELLNLSSFSTYPCPPYIVMLMCCIVCISSRIQWHAYRAYKHDLRRDQPTATTRVLAAGLAVGALAALHSPPTCVLAAAEPNPLPSRETLATAAGWAWGQLASWARAGPCPGWAQAHAQACPAEPATKHQPHMHLCEACAAAVAQRPSPKRRRQH